MHIAHQQRLLPVIGITIDCQKGSKGSYSVYDWYCVRKQYAASLTEIGAIPVMLPYATELVSHYIDLCDGIIFSGCDNHIDPKYYNETPLLQDPDRYMYPLRMDFESTLMNAAIEADIPIYGICAGMQLLNVLHQGTLIQDIAKQTDSQIDHARTDEREKIIHDITLFEGTMIHQIINMNHISVNSSHIQAVKDVGTGLKVTAISGKDGIIEAIEKPSNTFCIGVQWHPEFNAAGTDNLITKAFVSAAKQYYYKKAKLTSH